MKRIPVLLALAVLALGLSPAASAAVSNLVFGGAYAAGSAVDATTAEAYTGAGSWYTMYPAPPAEVYIDPAAQFGVPLTVGDIAAVRYRTLNDGTNPSGVDFFLKIYTVPYTGGDATWYGNRLNAEPLYANGYTPVASVWTEWTTDPGTNQLVFFDGNHTANFGFYGGPTLQDLTAGPVTWTDYPGAGGGSDPTPIDYASQPILYFTFGTGSGWPSFEGYLDAIEIETVGGDTYVIDLEDFVDEVWVDDDWAGGVPGTEIAPGRFFGHDAFATVQDGVDNVVGSTVNVAPGTYEEQVVIDGQDVLLQGAGAGSTIIQSPVSLAVSYTTGANDNYPVILATNSGNIVIRDLTVDGLGRGNTNYRFQGVAFYEAGGALLDVDVVDIRDTPFSGAQHGVAVYAYNLSGGPFALEIGGVDVTGFQKNAFALSGAGLTVDMHDCTMAGAGPTTVTAQNGIQISYGAGGTVRDCAVADVDYTPNTFVASGLLIYQGSTVVLDGGMTITDCQMPVYWQDTAGSMDGLAVAGGATFDAVFVYNSAASKPGTLGGAANPPARGVPSPLPEDGAAAPGVLGAAEAASLLTVPISNSCFTGSALPGSWGIDAYSAGGAVDVTVTNCTVSNYDVGLATVGAAATLTATANAVFGNGVAGYDNTNSGAAQDAAGNWWGAADGPSGDGPGTGDAVASVGGEVSFSPWLIADDSATLCAFTPPDNAVVPVPDGDCISIDNACSTVDFTMERADSAPIRGTSVTFQLSPELELCSGLASIVEGSYLSSVGMTNMQVIDNGGGSYTVDIAILGLPCGATAASGSLFTVEVGAAGGDGTGTVTVTSVLARDCDNGPVALTAGAPVAITIDTDAPLAIGDLAAAQLTSGNDDNGTTKIQLTYTPVGGTVEVFRKGFGDYPEYDDGSGAVPAVPTDPGDALANGWVSAGSPASGDFDEPAARDFWYYVAFSTDACGNVSPPSNLTGGTLNYHLGDVSDGVTPGDGDNVVDLFDISALGAAYGTFHGDALYRNFIDVGPTTDFTVNARPTTDNQIQFEDLILFAINYGTVSKPLPSSTGGTNALALAAPGAVAPGEEFEAVIRLAGNGSIVGLSVPLVWDPKVVEPVETVAGDLLLAQAGPAQVFLPRAGTVDAAVFGAGFSGDGTLAVVRFRALTAGDPAIGFAEVIARDRRNGPVPVEGVVTADDPRRPTPTVTALLPAAPNPFRAGTSVRFTLAEAARVSVRIYSLDGRLVRELTDEAYPAGETILSWDGRDGRGREVAAGAYRLLFRTGSTVDSRGIVRLR